MAMTTDSQYSWTSFYMELADRLLAFKDDRHSLVVSLFQVYRRIGMSLPKWAVEHASDDIDPFTVFALFNQGQKDSSRERIAAGLAEELCLSSPVPSDFSGAEYLRGVSSYFVNLYWVAVRSRSSTHLEGDAGSLLDTPLIFL